MCENGQFVIDLDELESVKSITITYDDGSVLIYSRNDMVTMEKLE